ncbi:MAG: glycosyltransferase family 39 protein [Usitatibacter sp.]
MSRRSELAVLGAAMAVAALLLVPRLHGPVSFDGKAAYLPMARAVLEQGWAYMLKPESLTYAPLSFLYPALLGAREALVRETNIALYCAAIALAFFALKTASGTRAAAIGAFLVALSPTLRPYIADVLTEPPFVFLIAAWILCLAKLDAGGARGWAIAGGAAFALATLVRPATMYFAPLAMLFFAWRRRWPLAAMHAIASVGIGHWVLRNALTFGFPAIAGGAGGALYFGVNPLVDGFDPPYYGMGFDSGLAQDSDSHLSIHADRRLSAIALTELRDTPLGVIARMFLHKLFAFFFVTSADISGEPLAWLRTWRIALVVLAAAGAIAHRRSAFAMTIAAFAAYMAAVHVPLLYTHRYSVGALDLPLTILAALGAVALARHAAYAAAALMAGVVATGVGLVQASAAGPLAPHPERIPNEVMWLASVEREWPVEAGAPIHIDIAKDPGTPIWDLSMLQMDLAASAVKPGACKALRIRFKRAAEERYEAWRAVRIPIASDGAMHRYTVGSTVPLALDGAGTLELAPECDGVATVRIGSMAVIAPKRERYYRDLYLKTR